MAFMRNAINYAPYQLNLYCRHVSHYRCGCDPRWDSKTDLNLIIVTLTKIHLHIECVSRLDKKCKLTSCWLQM